MEHTYLDCLIQIMNLLMEAASENDSTLLAVTHDKDLVSFFDSTIDFNIFLAEGVQYE